MFTQPVSPSYRGKRQRAIARTVATIDLDNAHANLCAVLARSSEIDWTAGEGWYSVAHETALDISSLLGSASPVVGAGIIAALSPQLSWVTNVEKALALAQGEELGADVLPISVERATAIKDGADPCTVLGGRKVRSFYANILRPLSAGPVTIDRHAVSILAGFPLSRNDKRLERLGGYQWAAAIYRDVARDLGELPQTIQATSWLTWRREQDELDRKHAFARRNYTDTNPDF